MAEGIDWTKIDESSFMQPRQGRKWRNDFQAHYYEETAPPKQIYGKNPAENISMSRKVTTDVNLQMKNQTSPPFTGIHVPGYKTAVYNENKVDHAQFDIAKGMETISLGTRNVPNPAINPLNCNGKYACNHPFCLKFLPGEPDPVSDADFFKEDGNANKNYLESAKFSPGAYIPEQSFGKPGTGVAKHDYVSDELLRKIRNLNTEARESPIHQDRPPYLRGFPQEWAYGPSKVYNLKHASSWEEEVIFNNNNEYAPWQEDDDSIDDTYYKRKWSDRLSPRFTDTSDSSDDNDGDQFGYSLPSTNNRQSASQDEQSRNEVSQSISKCPGRGAFPWKTAGQCHNFRGGQKFLDIIRELHNEELMPLINLILAQVDAKDLINMKQVSKTWQCVISGKKNNQRIQSYIQERAANKENAKKVQLDSFRPYGHSAFQDLNSAMNVEFSVKSEMPVSAADFEYLMQVQADLREGEGLKRCPKCSSLARHTPEVNRAVCFNKDCLFMFCGYCKELYHFPGPCRGKPRKKSRHSEESPFVKKERKRCYRRL